jgi:hypothetical protein
MPIANLGSVNPLQRVRYDDDDPDDAGKAKDQSMLSDAFNNAHGQLHKDTGTPQNDRISKSKLLSASKGQYGPKAKKRAQPVLNMEKSKNG